MKTLVIIRTFPGDDYLAYLCYLSFRKVMSCDFIFFAEHGEYKWLKKARGKFIFRDGCGNFGGQLGVRNCINYLRNVDVKFYDKIIFSDSDITMLKDPLHIGCEFGGIRDHRNQYHYSGQLLIYSKKIWNKVISYTGYSELIDKFVEAGIDVADDSIMSYVALLFANTVYSYPKDQYWVHEKNYHLEPK